MDMGGYMCSMQVGRGGLLENGGTDDPPDPDPNSCNINPCNTEATFVQSTRMRRFVKTI